jgi:hypothetical protein
MIENEIIEGRREQPIVCIAILAKEKEKSLHLYLKCIEEQDYPKKKIILYVKTNDNKDSTEKILNEWLIRVERFYKKVVFDNMTVDSKLMNYKNHQWDGYRFKTLAAIRQKSINFALEENANYYFVADCDNFLKPTTLSRLLELNLDIVAPFLTLADRSGSNPNYSNYHSEINENGYFIDDKIYHLCLEQTIRGIILMPVVHCTYLINCTCADKLYYDDNSGRHEYVIFSESARVSGVEQYLDNRMVYGYVFFDENDKNYHIPGLTYEDIEKKIFLNDNKKINETSISIKKTIIASHERSGTHMLMNKISSCTEYNAKPWIDIEENFAKKLRIENGSVQLDDSLHLNKTHFIPDLLFGMLNEANIFYIYRNPFDVMLSFWKYSKKYPDHAAPASSLSEFILSEPFGRGNIYNNNKHNSYIERWMDHVSLWLAAAKNKENIRCLSYEKLVQYGDNYLHEELKLMGVKIIPLQKSESNFYFSGAELEPNIEDIKYAKIIIRDYIKNRGILKIMDDGTIELMSNLN